MAGAASTAPSVAVDEGDKADYAACMLGLRDYVNKNGFKGVVLGLSGGIDSALVAALAVDALGRERVRCVMLPYRFTSQESLDDAAKVADALGVQYDVVPIESAVLGLEQSLAPLFKGMPRDVTEENLQARARGTILMAISNKLGLMVVTTGNKSEMSVGYATLYGDMNGGYNPVKDLYKTEVYRLSRLRNGWKPDGALGPEGRVIPENILTRAPTAELRENQTDQDSLPPYDVLDRILERLVEREEPIAKIVADGFDRETVMKVARMLDLAEYKRRQAAPGVKVTLKNFGRDRRYPIVNRFRDSGDAAARARPLAAQGCAGEKRSLRFLSGHCRDRIADHKRGNDVQSVSRRHAADFDHRLAAAAVLVHRGARLEELPRGDGQFALPRAVRGRGLVLPARAGNRRPRHRAPTAMRITTRRSAA